MSIPYLPNLAPGDLHLFLDLKKWLGGQRFQTNEELQNSVRTYLNLLAAKYYEGGINKLVHNCDDKCLNRQGDFVER